MDENQLSSYHFKFYWFTGVLSSRGFVFWLSSSQRGNWTESPRDTWLYLQVFLVVIKWVEGMEFAKYPTMTRVGLYNKEWPGLKCLCIVLQFQALLWVSRPTYPHLRTVIQWSMFSTLLWSRIWERVCSGMGTSQDKQPRSFPSSSRKGDNSWQECFVTGFLSTNWGPGSLEVDKYTIMWKWKSTWPWWPLHSECFSTPKALSIHLERLHLQNIYSGLNC